jgi:spore coat protein U-like protein
VDSLARGARVIWRQSSGGAMPVEPFTRNATMTVRHMIIAVAALRAATGARADTSATMQVTANVAKSCAISATGITLSDYNSLDATATSVGTGTITVQCTKNMAYDLKIDDGGYSTAPGARRMKSDTQNDYLTYALYQDSGHATPWTTTQFVSGTGTGRTAIPHTVYAFVSAGQDVSVGTYNDTVKVTITF